MKKHNASKVVLITIIVFLLLSWILPAAYYSGEYVDQGRVQMGLFDLFNYPLTALSYFGYIALFLILVGGFYGILFKIPAYRSFLDKVATSAKKHPGISLSLMILVNAVLVSVCGVQYGIALFVPFLVSLVFLMGYDKIVAAFVTVGSIVAGLIGTTYAYANTNLLTSVLGLSWNYQIWVRFIILFVAVALVIFNVLMYIKRNSSNVKITKPVAKKVEEKVVEEKVSTHKVEKKPTHTASKAPAKKAGKSSTKKPAGKPASKKSGKSTKASNARRRDNKAALKDEDVIVVRESLREESSFVPKGDNDKHIVWPFIASLAFMFVLFTLAFIAWGDNGFGVQAFDKATKAVQEFELFGFPIFGKILGTFNSFGNWSITDLFFPMAFVVCILALIYNLSLEEVFDGFEAGVKKALAPAGLVILIYSILVLVTYHPFQLVIYKALLGITKSFNIVTTVCVAMLSGLFNADIAYSFQSVLPYFVSVFPKADTGLVGIIFQTMYGLTMLIAPTSVVLMASLSYLGVSYKEWLKNSWKLLVELFIVLLIIFIILALI